MRRLHTEMPLGSERSSGSAVRFPVITTLFILVAATAPLPFVKLVLACCCCSDPSFESRGAFGRDAPAHAHHLAGCAFSQDRRRSPTANAAAEPRRGGALTHPDCPG